MWFDRAGAVHTARHLSKEGYHPLHSGDFKSAQITVQSENETADKSYSITI